MCKRRGEKIKETECKEVISLKQTVELCAIIMMMQGDELKNIAHSTHILKHEKTGMGSAYSQKELRRGLRLYLKEKPTEPSEVIPNRQGALICNFLIFFILLSFHLQYFFFLHVIESV